MVYLSQFPAELCVVPSVGLCTPEAVVPHSSLLNHGFKVHCCCCADCLQAHVLTLLADVAAGMDYLHQRNCVHGDLKPANVLLRKQQGAPFGHVAKVSDFGLSK